MAYWTGRATLSVSGNQSLTGVGFEGTSIRARVSKENGTTETIIHLSLGSADGTNQNCSYIYSDGTTLKTDDFNTKFISHWAKVGGVWTEVLSSSFVSFDADGFTVNNAIASPDYKVTFEVAD